MPRGCLVALAVAALAVAIPLWWWADPPCDRATPRLRLPFGPEAARPVWQGPRGAWSHSGPETWAWDFGMPVDTPVYAAAAGRVVEAVDGFGTGGPFVDQAAQANFIVIDHGNNRFSQYLHLRLGGVLVREGEEVARGQLIGRSGSTGYSTGPHLHFSVVDAAGRSVPVCFDGDDDRPDEGRTYAGPALEKALKPGRTPLSMLPADVFAENGITLSTTFPSRWFAPTAPAHLAGTADAKRVVALLYSRGARVPGATVFADVDAGGRFALDLDWRPLAPRAYLVLTRVREDGGYSSAVGVPVGLSESRVVTP